MARRWRDRFGRVGWILIGVAVVLPAVWVAARAVGAPAGDDFDRWVGWANVLALPVGALGTALLFFERAARRSPLPVVDFDRVDRALADLAVRLERDWAQEAVLREVIRPAPVLVRWSSTGRLAAGREVVLGEAGSDWRELPLRGEFDPLNEQIVEALRALPYRQLVVLGEPGAGKSVFAVLLTLGLIRARVDGEPLPVLLPINGWDPVADRVEAFVARRLVEDYPDVLAPYGEPALLARRLVEHQQVLPILDGLDELPGEALSAAVEVLDLYAAAGRPLVVTCRVREYERAVGQGRVLSRAAVIELEPVSAEAAVKFLSQPTPDARWEPVVAHLRESPDGPLAAALTTPLMVSLARTAYRLPSTDPADLITLPTREAVTAHLMDGFVTSVYRAPRGAQVGQGRRGRAYPPDRAARWLRCLAYHLDQTGTRDLQWWRIKPDLMATIPVVAAVTTVTAFVGLAAGAAGALGEVLGGGWLAGRAALAAALIVGVGAAGWLRPMWPHGYPRQVPLRYQSQRQRRRRQFRLRLGFGVGGGLLTAMVTLDFAALLAGVAFGLLVAVTPALRPPDSARRATPLLSVRRNRLIVAAAAAQYGLAGAVAFAAVAELVGHPGRGAVAVGVIAGLVYALAAALGAGGWTWARFRLTHARLVLRGWLPWRLWAFLDDAHNRSALRLAGPVYQFRHAILQDHLARAARHELLRVQAAASRRHPAQQLIDLLAEQGNLQELRAWADRGDKDAGERLAALLAQQGREDELRARAARSRPATEQLIELLVARGDTGEAIEILRTWPIARDRWATFTLIDLVATYSPAEEAIEFLRRSDDGKGRFGPVGRYARDRLVERLIRERRTDEAVEMLRPMARAGDEYATWRLPEILAQHGRLDEAVELLSTQVGAGDQYAPHRLVELLGKHGRVDAAIEILRTRAAAERRTGDGEALGRLVEFLVEHGRVEEAIETLRAHVLAPPGTTSLLTAPARVLAKARYIARISTGAFYGQHPQQRLTDLLVAHGRVDAAIDILRTRAYARTRPTDPRRPQRRWLTFALLAWRVWSDPDGTNALEILVDLLSQQGRAEQLTELQRVDAAVGQLLDTTDLADLLVRQGRIDEAIELLSAHTGADDQTAAYRLADLLARHGRLDDLQARATSGDRAAARRLVDLLAGQDRPAEMIAVLRILAAGGDGDAARRLARLLVGQDRTDEAIELLRTRADAGDRVAARWLVDLLTRQHRVEELRARARAGHYYAKSKLIDLLAELGRIDEAAAILRPQANYGIQDASRRLADLLAEHGRIDELRARADDGDADAANRLADILATQGRTDEAIRILQTRTDAGDKEAAVRLAKLKEP